MAAPVVMAPRVASVARNTKETKIQVSLSIDGGPLDLLPDSEYFPSVSEASDSHLSSSSSSGTAVPTPPGSTVTNPSSSSSSSSSQTAPLATIPPQTAETHASQSSRTQQIWIWTGIGFLDHMLHALAKHAGWSLRLRARGDLYIDDHHTAEDTFLALGSALSAALGPRTGIARFGHSYAPLDEALARCVVDLSNRPYFEQGSSNAGFRDQRIGGLATQMIPHCLQSWTQTAGATLHADVLRGKNDHHKAEALFKALAGALKMACRREQGREGEVVSTKGVL